MRLNMKTIRGASAVILGLLCWCAGLNEAGAHHVLGRPSYALNEDSNTPSAMQVETHVGGYFVNYMIFPAFPRPKEAGRVSLYINKTDGGGAFNGKVEFSVRDNSWTSWLGFDAHEEKLGAQILDDNVFRQGFLFRERGSYIITASFADDGGETHAIDFPLQVGAPPRFGPLGIGVTLSVLVLLGIGLAQRRQARSGQIRKSHAGGE